MTSPGCTDTRARSGSIASSPRSAAASRTGSTEGSRPRRIVASGAASKITHASCFPLSPAPCSSRASASLGCTCTESRSRTSRSFTSACVVDPSAAPNHASPIGPVVAPLVTTSPRSARSRSPPHTRDTRCGWIRCVSLIAPLCRAGQRNATGQRSVRSYGRRTTFCREVPPRTIAR